MKKLNKLLLSILPISSISLLSLVSCSTTSSNNKKPEENRTNNTPKKEPEKLPENSKKPNHSETNNQPNKSDSEKEPNTSENKNNIEPKEPNSEKENNDQPQADESNDHNVDFSDLEKIEKKLSFRTIYFYAQRDATTALIDLIRDPSIIDTIFSKSYKNIFNKYHIQFLSNNGEIANNPKGLIEKVKLKFTDKKIGYSKTLEFTFIGFKISESKNNKNNKQKYIVKKEGAKELASLYPSLVAYMLLYSQDHNEYKGLMETRNVINFEELENGNSNLFSDPNLRLNAAAIKDSLFEYNEELAKLYKDKVVAVSYNDYDGTLGLQIKIENREYDPKTSSEPSIDLKFIFTGFRKVSLTDEKLNVLSLFLPQNKFKELTKRGPLKTKIQNIKKEQIYNKEYLIEEKNNDYLKQQIFKNILVDINDNALKTYKSTETLSLQSKEYSSILGLTGNMSIYPFHTIITKDSIQKIYLSINKDEEKYTAKIDFELHIPIFASTLSDLKSHATSGDEKILKLKISQNTSID
ncbi:LppA family lipoprotein [Mycoplasma capricolum subsp. capricolum]|uniref:LppA family lipoprotein n=1 Tax=Mycoplasma capricolum TaxID=2095 RepID=UPI003DA58775